MSAYLDTSYVAVNHGESAAGGSGDVTNGSEEMVGFVISNGSNVFALAVDAEHRRKGLATALLRAVLPTNVGNTLTLQVRSSNYSAQHLYTKLNFQLVGILEGYYKTPLPVENGWLMMYTCNSK